MDPSLAAALWLRYHLAEALRNVRSPVVVDYRDLTRAPLAVARRLSEELSLTPPTGETDGALLDFVDASLNHEAPLSDRPGVRLDPRARCTSWSAPNFSAAERRCPPPDDAARMPPGTPAIAVLYQLTLYWLVADGGHRPRHLDGEQ